MATPKTANAQVSYSFATTQSSSLLKQLSTRESQNKMSSHSSLTAAADERKARLAKLKSLKRKAPSAEPEEDHTSPTHARTPSPPPSPSTETALTHLSGRNYDPLSKGPKLGFEAPPTLLSTKSTLEQQAAAIAEDVRRKAKEEEEDEKGMDLFKLQPKKPNWDLKRDLGRKMEVLGMRTDNAIARLVKKRIEASKKGKNGEEMGMEGTTLVEGVKLREREEEEDEKRENEDMDVEMI